MMNRSDSGYSKSRLFFYRLSPWILAAACVLLLFVLILFTVNNYQREKKLVTEALTQKCVTIIRFINSSSRESMRIALRQSQKLPPLEDHVQKAMEQAVEQPGVNYVALVDLHDTIIAGAGTRMVGEKIDVPTTVFLTSLRSNQKPLLVSWDTGGNESGGRFFQAAALFIPLGSSGNFSGMGRRFGGKPGMMRGPGHHPMFEHLKEEIKRLDALQMVIIVQLDVKQIGSPVKRQVMQMIILLVVFLLVAVGSLLSLLTLRGLEGSRVRLGIIEKELQRSERLAALGKMAAGVAHELRNPLSSIKGLTLLLRSKVNTESGGIETANILVQEVERLNRSIGELLDYAKPAKLNKISINLNVIVEKTLLLIGMDLQSLDISLDLQLAEELPVTEVDEDKMKQVFLNLFLNSIQAMEEGGVLTVASQQEGNNVVVIVEDKGTGISDQNLQKVFDPYFTTKNDGTGLGLAMSGKIVEEHGGKITLSSMVGQGTRVEVLLPVQPEP